MISFFLDIEMAIVLSANKDSFLDKILALNDRKMAKVVLSHKRWEECIDTCSPDRPHPILRLLDQMPDVFQILLDQCHTKCSLNPISPDYWEEFNFKCLDVTIRSTPDTSQLTDFDTHSQGSQNSGPREKIRHGRNGVSSFSVLQKLVKHRLESYMLHPIVLEYMSLKWSRFGFLFQITTLGIPFLLALVFSITVTWMQPVLHTHSLL